MKKNIRKAMLMAMVLMLAFTTTAMADIIVSPSFNFSGVQERPTEEPTAEPTVEPTAEPVIDPAAEATVEPNSETTELPAAEAEPTAEPLPEVTAEPVIEPTEEPLPEPTLSVSSNLAGLKGVPSGTEMVLTLTVEGAEGRAYTIQWQQSTDGGASWTDIAGANDHELRITLNPSHSGMYWRASVDIESPTAE